jgi:hypothetical protein
MKASFDRGARAPRFCWFCLLFLSIFSACFFSCTVAQAQHSDATIVRVEEEWELVVGSPHADSIAPQVVCAFSPVGHLQSRHATFELNHQTLPEPVSGGLQLQTWNGEIPLRSRKFPNNAVMAQPGETIRWTQVMQVSEGELKFEIINGSSTTWGAFGGQGYLKASTPTYLTNLNGYNPSVSTSNSGVSYAANRVTSLVLKKIRIVTSDGQVMEDATARVVH